MSPCKIQKTSGEGQSGWQDAAFLGGRWGVQLTVIIFSLVKTDRIQRQKKVKLELSLCTLRSTEVRICTAASLHCSTRHGTRDHSKRGDV